MSSLIFFSDADVFGGHEAMALRAVRQLCLVHRQTIHFVYFSGNARLAEALSALAKETEFLRPVPTPYCVLKLNFLQAGYRFNQIRGLAATFAAIASDTVLLIQGRIENGTLGALAARKARKTVLSYLPLAHDCKTMGRAHYLGIRDWLVDKEYGRPDGFITISDSIRQQILRANPEARIEIACNPLPPALDSVERDEAQRLLELDPVFQHIAVVGRIDFEQKGQDLMVGAIQHAAKSGKPWRFHFYGEGPDEAQLATLIAQSGVAAQAFIHGYLKDGARLIKGFEMVTIPSRFEGVPLIMFEALDAGVPVTGSARDGMKDWLPAEWLYDPEDGPSVVAAIDRVLSQRGQAQETCARISAKIPDERQFGDEFMRAIQSLQRRVLQGAR
jgi:glycosyltransferase involved in cell wall biosynthesis